MYLQNVVQKLYIGEERGSLCSTMQSFFFLYFFLSLFLWLHKLRHQSCKHFVQWTDFSSQLSHHPLSLCSHFCSTYQLHSNVIQFKAIFIEDWFEHIADCTIRLGLHSNWLPVRKIHPKQDPPLNHHLFWPQRWNIFPQIKRLKK